MKYTLADLVLNDLSDLADPCHDIVASEETIRFILHLNNKAGKLKNAAILKKDDSFEFFQAWLTSANYSESTHYQFCIEVGNRSKLKQGDPDTIHYCAMDFYLRPDKKPLAIVVDHYRRQDGFYDAFKMMATQLNIHFVIVASNDIYQADSIHCPIFTIQHLLLTASDPNYLPQIEALITDDATTIASYFNWSDLSPSYLVNAQSIKTLLNYVDATTKKEQLPLGQASQTLVEQAFADSIQASLKERQLQTIVDNKQQIITKLINEGIRYTAGKQAGHAALVLEQDDYTNNTTLIDICYQKPYPLTYALLHKALQIQRGQSIKPNGSIYSLLQLVFNHATVIEHCLADTSFNNIMTNIAILHLIINGTLNPHDLFRQVTLAEKRVTIDKQKANIIAANLFCLTTNIPLFEQFSSDELVVVLSHTKTKTTFSSPTFIQLQNNPLAQLNHLKDICNINVIDQDYLAIDDDDNNYFTDNLFDLENIGNDDDLFDVPPISTVTISPVKEKPTGQTNVHLLAKSISKALFKPQNTNKKTTDETSSLTQTARIY